MRISIVTIFPDMFPAPLDEGMIRIARERGVLEVALVNLRDHTKDKHRTTDDAPFGGGVGMIMLAEPFFRAVEAVAPEASSRHVVLLSPQGHRLDQELVRRLAQREEIVLLCGRYEGVDARVGAFVDEEISIGDFVLSGGEVPALVVIDALARLAPGALGNAESAADESFTDGLLEYPQFTRPEEFRGLRVPDVLLSGDHAKVAAWRRRQALLRTRDRRPDLLRSARLTDEDRGFLAADGRLPDPPKD